MKPYWQGVFPAVTTQMRRSGDLDLDATARHLAVLIDSGVAGLVMCGSLGENQVLDPEEKRAVVETAVGSEWVRAPRLQLVGAERSRVLDVIRRGIAERSRLPAAYRPAERPTAAARA
jgi:4-hydroxy-tetrahydrodipicolinate synthase